jgi:hypothetical protein
MMSISIRTVRACALALAFTIAAPAQNGHKITTPREALGFDIGDDYYLANYTQLSAWWQKLAAESDRMKLVEIGKTEEGRPQWMAVITSPENQKKLAHYKEIARRLATAEGLTDDEAHALAHEGKAVVWIDGGLHASEVLGAAQLMEFVYEMVSRNDPETLRILNDVVILAVHANPDGMELVSNWYMREADAKKRSTQNVPRLWQARQQPRFLHVQHEGIDEHEPYPLYGVVPADHVQPSSDGTRGRGDVRASIPRSFQLQF